MISMPISTLLIWGVALALSIASGVVTRLFVDLKKERRVKAEVSEYRKELKEAMASGNRSRAERLKKRERQMRQQEFKLSTGRMKVMFIFWIPFIGVYYLLVQFVGGFDIITATAPFEIPFITALREIDGVTVPVITLFWWYLVSSMAFSSIVTKITGTSTP